MRIEVDKAYAVVAERREQISPETSRQLVHELRLQRAELEQQNAELRRMQTQLATACARYFDLNEPQPVGDASVNATEHILQANLTAVTLLGLACAGMVGQPMRNFILAQDRIRVSDLALKAVSQGVLITTPDLHVVAVNPAFQAMTGYSEAELLGANCARLNGPLTDAASIAAFLVAAREQREFAVEILHYRKDGSSFWNALVVSPVLDDQGRLTHFISINTDISERKRLDQALLDKNLQLQQATAMAEQANRAKSDFLSSMSHELRTPLNSILGFAQLLESGTPVPLPHQQKSIGMILQGGWYLLTLINEILDLSSIESGKLALSLAPLPLARLLQDCESMVEPQATHRGIRISFPVADRAQRVVADPVRLKQVLVNLLSNAIKYNRPEGAVDVQVHAHGQGRLRICVHDTGRGLAPAEMAQLFQPFNRLGQESSSIEGTGIGLVLSRRLAELMGGSVGVQSTVGEGSIFWVELLAAPD